MKYLKAIQLFNQDNSFYIQLPTTYLNLVIRRLVIVVMDSLICTATGRLIQVVAQVDVQLLSCAHIPGTLVWPVHARNAPLKVIATPCKCAVCVLGLGEAYGERHVVDGALLGNIGI